MITHVCSDCGAQFHTYQSWAAHQCDARCAGDCDHARCSKCAGSNPSLQCNRCRPADDPAYDLIRQRLGEWHGPIR